MKEIIGLPTLDGNGANAQCSPHFGGAPFFTIVEVENGQILNAQSLENPGHGPAGCMGPVNFMKEHGVSKVIVLGIGGRPMMGFQQVGIAVYRGIDGTVEDNIEAYIEGKLKQITDATCLGRGG